MRKLLTVSLGVGVLLLSGCASSPTVAGTNTSDPFEGYNRGMTTFNNHFMDVVVIPATKGYNYVLPSFARTGISNFFQNVGTISDIGNDILQFNFHYMVIDIARLLINTTIGVGGLFDMAAKNGIYAHPQSFGYTLNKWGWKHSDYLVLPILGPSTVRGTVGLVPDMYMSPIMYIKPVWARYSLTGLNALQTAANFVPQQQSLMAMSLDPYVALRDAYLQNQAYIQTQINYDGFPPEYVHPHHALPATAVDANSVRVQEAQHKQDQYEKKQHSKQVIKAPVVTANPPAASSVAASS